MSLTQIPEAMPLANLRVPLAAARSAIEWAVDSFGPDLCLLSSMQDAVLIDLALQVDPTIDVVFLDNGYHFAETIETLRVVEARYDVEVRRVTGSAVPRADVAAGECCDEKVALLDDALLGKRAWLSGIRRDETTERASAGTIELDRRGLFKINPLASWTAEDVATLVERRSIPVNPLLRRGFSSVGCEPCTVPATVGRTGRWPGTERTECGLHR